MLGVEKAEDEGDTAQTTCYCCCNTVGVTRFLCRQVILLPLQMESAIDALIAQFKAFAGKDGSSETLSKEEFRSLVASQLPTFVPNGSDPGVADQLMGSLDKNNDGQLTFTEFWQLIGTLALQHSGFHQ
ncbi:protein S100-A11-like [Arapaima gigas]